MGVDWKALFVPESSLAEIFVRGTFVYLALFSLLRFVLKRQSGTIAIGDLLVIVLIADAAQNAMAGEYRSITAGIFLVATLLFWNFVLESLGFRYSPVQRFVHPTPLELIRNGRIVRENLKRELLPEEELKSQLRLQGIEDVREVKRAFMEGDGRISVLKKDAERHEGPARKTSG